MADVEAATEAPPLAPALAPASRRTGAAAAVDAVIYCCLGAISACYAASIVLVVARHVAGERALAVASAAAAVFVYAHVAAGTLCLLTVPMLLVRLERRQAEPPELLVETRGVYVTVQVHGPERPGARGMRQGAGYGLIALLVFVFFLMNMLVGLLLEERSPVYFALISDIGSFFCSVMVIGVFIPYMLVQMRGLPEVKCELAPVGVTP
ncbi:hypothetical protein ACP70R_000856 [Stipagrostis hirtigluma subsp. patula]